MKFPEAVQASEALGPHLQSGLRAVSEKAILVASTKHSYRGSIDIDTAYQPSEPYSSRWDYVIGIARKPDADAAVWIEIHPASSSGNVGEVAKKRAWLIATIQRDAIALAAM